MKFISTAELREKDVINLCDGVRLGCPTDFEVDVSCGRIATIIVACDDSLFGFGKRDEMMIPWDKIKCIGEDAILVSLDANELQCCTKEKRKKKKTNPKMQ